MVTIVEKQEKKFNFNEFLAKANVKVMTEYPYAVFMEARTELKPVNGTEDKYDGTVDVKNTKMIYLIENGTLEVTFARNNRFLLRERKTQIVDDVPMTPYVTKITDVLTYLEKQDISLNNGLVTLRHQRYNNSVEPQYIFGDTNELITVGIHSFKVEMGMEEETVVLSDGIVKQEEEFEIPEQQPVTEDKPADDNNDIQEEINEEMEDSKDESVLS